MLVTKRTCKKKYAAGIFGSIGNFFARMFSSNAEKQLDSAALQAKMNHRINNVSLTQYRHG